MLRLSTDIPELARSDDRRDFRTENRIGEEDPVILHVGRFIEQKNHAGVLGVFRRVLDRIPSAKLVLLGHGPLKDSVMKQIATMGIETSVRYLGLRNDVPRIMTMSDVFLFPSLDEGFGLAALEANAAGLPVVGSLIDGLREAVVNEETAMLFPVRDVPAMADAVVTLLLDSSKRYAMGQAGRLRARTTYSHEASASRLLELYNEVLTR
ncbi:MAG: glycosyltransferase family 4 protein [Deltaproteobacteria bacterium]|nr:glycosyltransferase family 4 protein [Deltaproteobacteria bacterium]